MTKWASAYSPADTSSGKFEQSVYRSAKVREGRTRVRSCAGDLDLTIFSLRKWARLALQGNPTVLLLQHLPDDALVIRTDVGEQLQKLAPAFARSIVTILTI